MTVSTSGSATLKTLLVLAWPVVLTRSSQAVIGFADALMIAPLGEVSLAAVTTGALNFFALVIFPMGLAFIVQSFASQYAGRDEPVAARRYGWYGLILSGGFLVLSLVAIPFIDALLGVFPYEPEVHGAMSVYLGIRLLAVAPFVATEVLGNFFAGLGNTAMHMRASLATMVLNVALNWLLIGGNMGFPALGIEGAAIASLTATIVGLTYLGFAFARGWVSGLPAPRSAATRRAGGRAGPVGLSWDEFSRMLRFGVPSGFNWFLEFSAFWIFINVIVAGLGTTVLAGMMVVMEINSISFMPSLGVGSAGAILVGQAIGSENRREVSRIVRLTLATAAIWQCLVGVVYILFPEPLMMMFAPGGDVTAQLVTVGAVMLALSAGWQLFDAGGIVLGEALRAAGDTAWIMWARLGLAWVLFVPAAWFFVVHWEGGYVASILCIIGYLAVLSGVFALRMKSGAWQRIDLLGKEVVPEIVPEPVAEAPEGGYSIIENSTD